jgi:hypothetical protein
MGTPSKRVQKWAKKEREKLMKEGGGRSSFTAWKQTPKSKAVDEKKYKKKSKTWLADKNKAFKQQPIRPANVGATASILRKTDKTGNKSTYDYEGPGGMAPEREPLRSASKKTVKQKTTTYQGKKGDTIKPKVKESTTEYWKKSKKGPGYVPEKAEKAIKGEAKGKSFTTQEKAKVETDDRVQKQINSGFGDWSSSDNFKKKMKSGSDAFKKKMESGSASFKSKMKSGSDAFKAKMKASEAKFKKKMGG